jgi:hypothetical protein
MGCVDIVNGMSRGGAVCRRKWSLLGDGMLAKRKKKGVLQHVGDVFWAEEMNLRLPCLYDSFRLCSYWRFRG